MSPAGWRFVLVVLAGLIFASRTSSAQVLEAPQAEEEEAEAMEEAVADAMADAEISTRVRVGGEIVLEGDHADGSRIWEGVTVRLEPAISDLMIEENVKVDAAGKWIARGSLLGQDSIGVSITADHEDFVYDKDPVQIYLSPWADRETGLTIVLVSRDLARTRARVRGDAGVQRVILRSLESDTSAVLEVLGHYDRALRFRRGEDVYDRKADFLARIEWYPECIEASDQWIAYRREEADSGASDAPWRTRLFCARRQADRRKADEDWDVVVSTARDALERGFDAARYAGNWLDALLVRTESGGDFRLFGRRIVESPEWRSEWIQLYYRHFRNGEDPPGDLTVGEVTCGAIRLAKAIGRPTANAGCAI